MTLVQWDHLVHEELGLKELLVSKGLQDFQAHLAKLVTEVLLDFKDPQGLLGLQGIEDNRVQQEIKVLLVQLDNKATMVNRETKDLKVEQGQLELLELLET